MMRSFIAGAPPAPRIQDPFGLRTLPQVHGALLDALERLNTVVGRLANAPSENPRARSRAPTSPITAVSTPPTWPSPRRRPARDRPVGATVAWRG